MRKDQGKGDGHLYDTVRLKALHFFSLLICKKKELDGSGKLGKDREGRIALILFLVSFSFSLTLFDLLFSLIIIPYLCFLLL